jgi:hypothetical protein
VGLGFLVRLRFALRSLVVWRVCAIAPSLKHNNSKKYNDLHLALFPAGGSFLPSLSVNNILTLSQSVGHALRSGLSCCHGYVTLQLDFQNAFNSVSRTALLQAVASRAPRLLPFAAWTYRSHGPLVVRGASADAPPLTSQSGVRQGGPCGPLLFALALQGPLERIWDAFPDVRVVAYADDVHLQGPPEAAIEAFRLLVTATAPIGLAPSLPKCAVYAQSAATGLAVASALGIAHRPEGLVAAGRPLGLDAFVETDARSRAETVASLVTALASLPLGKQDKFLLRSSLQARLTHLTRITPWSQLSPHVAAAERQVLLAALDLVQHPPPAEMQSDPVVAQLALPLRSGGFDLRLTAPLEADAAFLAVAGAADVAMRPAPPPFRPFNPASPHCAALVARWVALPLVPGASGAHRAPPRPGPPARPAGVRPPPCGPAVCGPAGLRSALT